MAVGKNVVASLNGIISTTSFKKEEVLSTEIMGKFCFVRHNNPTTQHKYNKNYEKTGFGIEFTAVLNILPRYTKYLGDGDSKVH